MTRCISCGRLPTETHCDICHRVARALQTEDYVDLFVEALRSETAEINTEATNQ